MKLNQHFGLYLYIKVYNSFINTETVTRTLNFIGRNNQRTVVKKTCVLFMFYSLKPQTLDGILAKLHEDFTTTNSDAEFLLHEFDAYDVENMSS